MVGLEKITNRIIFDANAEAEKIIAEAASKCDEIFAEHEKKCDEIRAGIEADAVAECENIKSRSISGMAMYRRDRLMNVRVEVLDRAFAKARDEILSLEPDKYKDLLASLLCRVLEEQTDAERESMRLYGEDISPETYEVIMNRTDRESYGVYVIAGVRRGTIGKITGEVLQKVHLSDSVADISGGIILKCGDIEINSSFDTMLAELREKMEAEVEAELFRYMELYEETEEADKADEPEETVQMEETTEAVETENAMTEEDTDPEEQVEELEELETLAEEEDTEGLEDLERLEGADAPVESLECEAVDETVDETADEIIEEEAVEESDEEELMLSYDDAESDAENEGSDGDELVGLDEI